MQYTPLNLEPLGDPNPDAIEPKIPTETLALASSSLAPTPSPLQKKTEIHRLLKRQIKRFLNAQSLEPLPKDLQLFIHAINQAYHQFDDDRALLERSLDLSSQELMEANDSLLSKNKQLHDINQTRHKFLAIMSHEIRTPLNAIIGLNDHLLDIEENITHRHYLKLAKTSSNHLLSLINDILDLSKIEVNQLVLEKISFNLPNLIHTTIKIVQDQACEKDIFLSVHIAPDLPSQIIGDPQRLTQILLNLVGNAIKFTPEGGVTVEIKPWGDNEIYFSVADTGIGIARDKQESIFQPFTQADNSTTRRFGGTGLGLDICQKLVGLMGGRIWVESEVGVGSTFQFTCRFPEGMTEPHLFDKRSHKRREAQTSTHPLNILLAEDMEENTAVIQAFLSTTPYHLDAVNDGAKAVNQFKLKSYDLVLMDVQMPVMDGFTATREIRAWEKNNNLPSTPILALTAHALQDVATQILEAGCDLHMTKPISKKRLLDVIQLFTSEDDGHKKKIDNSNPDPSKKLGYSVVCPPVQKQNSPQEPLRASLLNKMYQGLVENTKPMKGFINHLSQRLFDYSKSVSGQPPKQQDTESAQLLNLFTLDKLLRGMEGNSRPIKQFGENLPQRIIDISNALSDHSPNRLGTTAHQLKGAARTFGAERLAVMSHKLEIIGKNNTLPEDDTLLDALKAEAVEVKQALSDFLRNHSAPP